MIRCAYCGAPLPISRKLAAQALQVMDEEGLQHFDLPCPRCRKINKLPRQALLRYAPRGQQSDTTKPQT
ncbi:MAG: hypothetical protein GXO36_01800 [Chloroflexi bacterium]|nr:hypothetical protein [Chloroflexota bacterium]